MRVSSSRPLAYYAAFFTTAWLRRIVTYAAVVYGYEVLGGGLWSGIFYLCLVLPYLFSLYAGSVIDASSKRTVLHVTSNTSIVLLGLMALADHQHWLGAGAAHGGLMAALIGAFGIVSAFSYPAFFAVIPDLVERSALGRTTALANVLSMLCYACGPLAAGALHAYVSWPVLFAVLAVIAVAVRLLLGLVPLPAHDAPRAPAGSEWSRVRELMAYCREHRILLALLIASGVFGGVVVGPLEVLSPLYAQDPLHCSPFLAGVFIGTGGLGLVAGAIAALWLVDRGHLGAWLCGSGVGGCACVVAMTFVPLPAAFVLFFLGGFLGGVFNSLSVAGIQSHAPDALRGRVLGLFTLIIGAIPALGGLASGALIEAAGTVVTMRVAFSLAVASFALLYFVQPALRNEPSNS